MKAQLFLQSNDWTVEFKGEQKTPIGTTADVEQILPRLTEIYYKGHKVSRVRSASIVTDADDQAYLILKVCI